MTIHLVLSITFFSLSTLAEPLPSHDGPSVTRPVETTSEDSERALKRLKKEGVHLKQAGQALNQAVAGCVDQPTPGKMETCLQRAVEDFYKPIVRKVWASTDYVPKGCGTEAAPAPSPSGASPSLPPVPSRATPSQPATPSSPASALVSDKVATAIASQACARCHGQSRGMSRGGFQFNDTDLAANDKATREMMAEGAPHVDDGKPAGQRFVDGQEGKELLNWLSSR